MAIQSFIVGLIVIACGVYTVWTVMPAAARRALATRLLRVDLPAALAKPLRKALQPASACGGCDNCGDAAPKSAVKPLVFQRRASR